MLGQKSRKAKQNALIQNRCLTCPRQVSRFQLQQVHARGRNRSGHCLSGRQSGETWKRLALKSGCKIRTGRSGPTELAILSIYSFKFWGIFFWTILIWVAATAQAFFAAKGSIARTAADKIFPWYLKWWGTPGAKWSQWDALGTDSQLPTGQSTIWNFWELPDIPQPRTNCGWEVTLAH